MKKPTVGQSLAMQAARAAASHEDDEPATLETAPEASEPSKSKGGRPRGKRPVAARQTLYLDEARHEALSAIALDRGRSIHSLIIEGVDLVIGKPNRPGWRWQKASDADGSIPPS